MTKLNKQMYITANGEKKINCYKINLSKELVKKSNIDVDKDIRTYTKDNKIIIENEKGE